MPTSHEKEQPRDHSRLRKAAVVEMLHRYIPAQGEEMGHKNHILSLLESSPGPFAPQSFSTGHVTASALIFDDKARHVLLIHHKGLKQWLQPGGHVDPEDGCLVDTVVREVQEEVGLLLPKSAAQLFDVDVHEIPAVGDDPQHLHFDFRFLFRCKQSSVQAASDATDARWFPLSEAAKLSRNEGMKRLFKKCAELNT